ncbi:MAG TPA: hypothetical protein PKW08_13035 [Flavobacteriaceae bacterium]|nr:hypothetical protein [Flavobacteriaceae bacterium]HQU22506.1 hypothetical protein [Flavobacteriaceae bacterium]HQU66452.1 hypothetical protein [Flavobacteriaceae bacterium]
MMEAHRLLNDDLFLEQFKACTLEPTIFSHEAHLRLAYLQLQHYGLETALELVPRQLQNYVAHLGAETKYHATLTIAAVHAVYHFMQRTEAIDFYEFIDAVPQLKYHFKELLASHYGFDLFENTDAKASYIPPDLIPFEHPNPSIT